MMAMPSFTPVIMAVVAPSVPAAAMVFPPGIRWDTNKKQQNDRQVFHRVVFNGVIDNTLSAPCSQAQDRTKVLLLKKLWHK